MRMVPIVDVKYARFLSKFTLMNVVTAYGTSSTRISDIVELGGKVDKRSQIGLSCFLPSFFQFILSVSILFMLPMAWSPPLSKSFTPQRNYVQIFELLT
jgi:hypothetical protein